MTGMLGYAGKVLRVNLADRSVRDEPLDEQVLRRMVGGTGLGVHYLYREVPPAISWHDPANRIVFASGPLGGTKVSGSGTFSVVTKGALTNMATATQANGFLGAYMRLCGYDGIVIEGAASEWLYLHVDDSGAHLSDAAFLIGKDTWQVEDAVKPLHADSKHSVFSIGPAGEHLVKFAGIVGDRGHAAAHNGVGAVMGSKKLKAIAIAQGKHTLHLADSALLQSLAKASAEATTDAKSRMFSIHSLGTAGLFSNTCVSGLVPVKNYTTNLFPEHEQVSGSYTREHFQNKKMPCWSCQVSCCRMTTVTEGPYAGFAGEEPEYEGFAACTAQIGQTDAGAAIMLGNLIDRLGLDINETGWILGFAIECFQKGLIDKSHTGGLELNWGDAEAAATLLKQIANREHFGNVLAEGVRDAVTRMGGEALKIGVFTTKGNSPRGHDHRAKWDEMLDTCLSSTGTIELNVFGIDVRQIGAEPVADKFSWQQISTLNGKINGWRQFTDCLGVCNFNFVDANHEVGAVNAATGWQMSIDDAMTVGRRVVNLMRVYNMRCGLTPEMEEPSARYASIPVDGPAAGADVRAHWGDMRRNYFRLMGWDDITGRPKPETLMQLGLEDVVGDLAAT